MIRINLVAFENGVGNSRDIALLRHALASIGCEVTLSVPSKHARRRRRLGLVRAFARARLTRAQRAREGGRAARFDMTVMLEHVWPEALHLATRNLIVPNPEFFDRHDQRMLGCFDAVWAKTRATEALFRPLGRPTRFTGFDSEDRYLEGGARAPTFLHVAGKSRMKGTARLVELWSTHPEWPRLTLVQSVPGGPLPVARANIVLRSDYLSDAELKALQNENGIHLCTSETEGWGHYIAEAESAGAIVIATDAAPMNELVRPERGFLVDAQPSGRQHLATTFEFDAGSLGATIERVLALGDDGRRRLGEAARAWFLWNKRDFPARLTQALEAD